MSQTQPFARSLNDRMIAGVIGGIAQRMGWSPTLLRVLFVIASIASAAFPGIIVYLILWLLMPNQSSSRVHRQVLRVLQSLGVLWTLPNSVVGLVGGALGIPFGARPRFNRRELALVFHRWPWGPGGAITLGNVILHTGTSLDARCATYEHRAGRCVHPAIVLGDHERAHVFQYMALGPLFLPLYLACGGVSVRNRFERAADRYALIGAGWWPFA